MTGLDPRIGRKLAGLRRTLRGRLLGEGLARVIVALVAAALLTLAIDYGLYLVTRLHMNLAQRLLVLALVGAGVACYAYRRLVRPQLVRLGDQDLALVVERTHPELQDRLISALQFGRMGSPESAGASAALVEKLTEQANRMSAALSFGEAVRADRLMKRAGAALAAVAVVGALWAGRAEVMNAWLARMVMLREAAYPRDTYLSVQGPARLRVGRGSSLEVVVTADPRRVVPREVTFHMSYPSMGTVDETVQPSAGSAARFVKRFDVVAEPFTFYVTGNDDRTATCTVEVAEPPQLWDVWFTVTHPDYTHLRPRKLSAEGELTIPIDSTVVVEGTATKDLREASVILEGQAATPCAIQGGADGRPRAIRGVIKATAPTPFKSPLSLRFAVTDSEGFATGHAAQFKVYLVQDKPPAIQLQTVGIGGQISTRAVIPLQVSAEDDYGVRQTELEWSVLSAAEKRTREPMRTFNPDERKPAAFVHAFDLQAMSKPGAPAVVGVGESLRLVGIALDTLPEPQGPNWAVSNPITVKVAADEELLAALVDSQRVMREQFRQAITMQSQSKGKCDTAAERAREQAGLAEAQQLAGEAADQQQQITDRVTAVQQRFDEIVQQLRNNRIGAEAEKMRLANRVVAPLKDLAENLLKKVAAELLAAKVKTDGGSLAEDLSRISMLQKDALARMDAALAEMIKVENAQAVEHGLKVILDMAGEVQKLTGLGPRAATQPATRPQ